MTQEIIAGKFKVVKSLGQGTQSKVFLAESLDLGVSCALKVFDRGAFLSPNLISRLEQSALILKRFEHPRAARLRDFGSIGNTAYYLASDYWEGMLLENLLAQYGRFQLAQALELIAQLGEVLEAAHASQIIHRDIKPANIMVVNDPSAPLSIRLLNLGVANLEEMLSCSSSSADSSASLGTPAYMSPEQCTAETDIDQRADIYAAGIVLYEMITGEVPYSGENVVQTLLKHLTQPLPPVPAELNVPSCVIEIIGKALEKRRADRFQSAAKLAQACRQALDKLQVRPVVAKPVKCASPKAHYPSRSEPESVSAATKPAAPAKILCLDDNHTMLQLLQRVFERAGYQVFTASSFAVIHDMIFLEGVSVLLCDVCLPGMQGDKICRLLKKTMPKLKIILFSNTPSDKLEKLAVKAKADAWLSKTTKPSEWVAKVKEVETAVQEQPIKTKPKRTRQKPRKA